MVKQTSVTFDSNVYESLVLLDKLKNHEHAGVLAAIRKGIESGVVAPYISDVIPVLEAIREKDRGAVFAGTTAVTERKERDGGCDESGMPVEIININVKIALPHPGQTQQSAEALQAAVSMGFKLIKVPRVAFPMAKKDLYKEIDGSELAQVLDRCVKLLGVIEAKGFGSDQARELGETVMKEHPELGRFGPLIACGHSTNKKLAKAIAEWADGDAVAAHYGYGHDFFCTLDRGKSAGGRSILNEKNRNWLLKDYGVRIVSPSELANNLQGLLQGGLRL